MSDEIIESGATMKNGALVLLAGTIVKLGGVPCMVKIDTPIESEHYLQKMRMQQKQYFIVWNETKSEGFITSSEDDAEFARSGFQAGRAVSSLADSMRGIYADDGDEETELPAQTVTIDVEAAK